MLLVKRGGCSFVTKIKNAAAFGASLLIVSDYETDDIERHQSRLIKEPAGYEGAIYNHIPLFEIPFDEA